MKSACQFALVLCLTAVMSPAISNAAEIPLISSQEHCTLEVGKMLDKAEQAVEYEKCMNQESKFEPGVRKFWTFLPENIRSIALDICFRQENRTRIWLAACHHLSVWRAWLELCHANQSSRSRRVPRLSSHNA
jgi:hypothetical protein